MEWREGEVLWEFSSSFFVIGKVELGEGETKWGCGRWKVEMEQRGEERK